MKKTLTHDRKRNIATCFVFFCLIATLLSGILAGCGGLSLFFVLGDRTSMMIGESKIFEVRGNSGIVSLSSSDTSVIQIENGYARALSSGESVLTARCGKDTAKMKVTVKAPAVKEEFMFEIFEDEHGAIVAEGAEGETIYARAERDGKFCGEAIGIANNLGEAYITLDDLNISYGVYKIGVSSLDGESRPFGLTDRIWSKQLEKSDVTASWGGSVTANGTISVTSDSYRFGGVAMTLNVSDENGKQIPKIRVKGRAGDMWSVKVRKGRGLTDSYEAPVLDDTSVSGTPECVIDLRSAFGSYVENGFITIVIWAINETLYLERIDLFYDTNTVVSGVREEDYIPMRSLEFMSVGALRVGEEKELRYRTVPNDSSLGRIRILSDDDCVGIEGEKIYGKRTGKATIRAVDVNGDVVGYTQIEVSIAPDSLVPYGNDGNIVVGLSERYLDLSRSFRILPSSATDKHVLYSVRSGTAAVDPSGILTFDSIGDNIVRIASFDNGKYVELKVRVIEDLVRTERVELSNIDGSCAVGDKLKPSVRVFPERADFQNVIWISSDTRVATVDENGEVNVIRAGVFTVYAVAGDGRSFAEMTVTAHAVQTVSMNEGDRYLLVKLSDDVLSGDKIVVTAVRGGEMYSAVRIVPAPESIGSAGDMTAQRTILLDCGTFAPGEVVVEITVERNGEALNGYTVEEIGSIAPKAFFGDELFDTFSEKLEFDVSEGKLTMRLLSDGYACVRLKCSAALLLNASSLYAEGATGSCSSTSIKLVVGDKEFVLTRGDAFGNTSSKGCFRLDLTDAELSKALASAEEAEIDFYLSGVGGDTMTFDHIFLA